jgi:hypothetical protein
MRMFGLSAECRYRGSASLNAHWWHHVKCIIFHNKPAWLIWWKFCINTARLMNILHAPRYWVSIHMYDITYSCHPLLAKACLLGTKDAVEGACLGTGSIVCHYQRLHPLSRLPRPLTSLNLALDSWTLGTRGGRKPGQNAYTVVSGHLITRMAICCKKCRLSTRSLDKTIS